MYCVESVILRNATHKDGVTHKHLAPRRSPLPARAEPRSSPLTPPPLTFPGPEKQSVTTCTIRNAFSSSCTLTVAEPGLTPALAYAMYVYQTGE